MKIRSIISNIWPRKINPCLDLRHTVQITKLFKLLCRRTCMAPSMSPVALRSQVFLCLRGHCYRIMECKPGWGGGKSFVYSLFIECLPDSVVNAAFLSVPFQGVCSVTRCCGQSNHAVRWQPTK